MKASHGPKWSALVSRLARSALVASIAGVAGVGGVAGCKNDSEPRPRPLATPDAGSVDTESCRVDTDCGFGEIDHEILRRADCPCLYGCPYLPLNTASIERRQSQYDALCEPSRNGMGQGCGIDDCASPPPAACVAGKCAAAPGSD
jgi:hypothetical protein